MWSAGSTGKWYGTASLPINPFWIRRFGEDWAGNAQKNREDPVENRVGTKEYVIKEKTAQKVKDLARKTERGTDSFYTKRGISNESVYKKIASDWHPRPGEKLCITTSGLKANFVKPGSTKGTWLVWVLDKGFEGQQKIKIKDIQALEKSLGKCEKALT